MKNTFTIIIVVFLFLIRMVSAQTPGDLDLTFNGSGKVVFDKDQLDLYQDVKVQSDGKIVAVGTSYTPAYTSQIEVTRYLDNGSFDPSFGTNGHYNLVMNFETGAYACFIRPNGKIIIAGYTTDYATWSMLLIQLNSDGTPDNSFGTNGIVMRNPGPGENIFYALTVLEDGRILAAGYSQDNSYKNVPVLLRFSETGVPDSSFGTDGVARISVTENDNDFSSVCVQSDGKILAAGHISNGLSWFSLLIARFDQDGNPDVTYGTGGVVNLNLGNVDDEFFDMTITPDDETILAGFTVTQADLYYHLLLMKFDSNGQPVSGFGTNGAVISGDVPYTIGNALVLQPNGKILVAGCTGQQLPGNNDWCLWRFNADGSPDTSFGTNGKVTTEFFNNPDEALGIALHQNKIILAGKTRNASNLNDFALARYLNDVNVSVTESVSVIDFMVSPNPLYRDQPVNLVYTLPQTGEFTIEVSNTTGRTLVVNKLDSETAGTHSFQLKLPASLTSGVYFIRISGAEFPTRTKKIIVR